MKYRVTPIGRANPKHIRVNVLYSVGGVGTAILVEGKNGGLLVDAGDGTLRELVGRGYSLQRLKSVLLTHEHFDHLGGLMALIMFLDLLGRSDVEVLVPKPANITRKICDIVKEYRMMNSKSRRLRQITGFKIKEIDDDGVYSIAGLHVKPIHVNHSEPAVGYSIWNEEGYKVVISGDTALCKSLAEELQGADVAILDSTYPDKFKQAAVKFKHMTTSDCNRLGALAKKTIGIHKLPRILLNAFFDSESGDNIKQEEL